MSHSWLSVPIDSNFLQSIAGNGDERLFLEQREMLVTTTDYAGVMEAWAWGMGMIPLAFVCSSGVNPL